MDDLSSLDAEVRAGWEERRQRAAKANDEAIAVAARALLLAALDVIGIDGHIFGSRPCSTCTAVSSLAGRDFGCVAHAKRRG